MSIHIYGVLDVDFKFKAASLGWLILGEINSLNSFCCGEDQLPETALRENVRVMGGARSRSRGDYGRAIVNSSINAYILF